MTESETLRGELVAFRTHTPDGWGVGTVRAQDGALHKVTGKLLGVQPGDAVELAGGWMETKYGRQFKVRQCTSTVPQTTAGVVAWMASSLPDVGDRRALAMVSQFGVAGLWETIESNPRALCAIDGITPERADAIAVAYEEQRSDRDALIVLRGWGLTARQVERCVERWDTPAEVVEVVRANPYVLIEHVHGFGFKRADDVALRAGLALDSPLRIAAALHHVLNEAVQQGHCYLVQGKLRGMVKELLKLDHELIQRAMRQEYVTGRLVVRATRVYPPGLDADEAGTAAKLETILRLQHGRAA
jgi:exodeoxyribonuclease V alpha subunit